MVTKKKKMPKTVSQNLSRRSGGRCGIFLGAAGAFGAAGTPAAAETTGAGAAAEIIDAGAAA